MTGPRAFAAILLLSSTLGAQVAPETGGALAGRARIEPRFWIVPPAAPEPGISVPWMTGSNPRDTLSFLEAKARDFLSPLGEELSLNRRRSGPAGDHLWIVDFDVMRGGLPVEGARIVLRVNNGNLIQLGTEGLPAPGTPTPEFTITREQARAALADYLGGARPGDELLDSGSRHLLATQGNGLAAVWEVVLRRSGDPGTWRARIDAGTGEVLEFVDLNRYARATGGVRPDEAILPMPFVDLSTGGYSNGAGVYPYSGGPLSSQLKGKYVAVNDQCGPISLGSTNGHLLFGASTGTDCSTPGAGGAGNTSSARTVYYHVNRVKEAARGWLPANSWLQAQLPTNTNVQDTCNAYWNGASLTFFRSGGGCGNTGEIPDVAIHELGHGLDGNDGLSPPPGDLGTGETYGDILAAMTFRNSCMGEGFRTTNCGGYGDPCTDCTGVRDIDWAKRASGTPHTVANFTQTTCPTPGVFSFYVGPCGAHALSTSQSEKAREGHCESYVASEALWDLAARDLPGAGTAQAWTTFERLFYRSRSSAGRAFVCDTSTPVWTSHGCTADSYWRALRAADDDDGNLANGTPHSCHLFAAFNRHGMACPSDPGADVCLRGCTPPAVPVLSVTPDHQVVDVAWTSSGPGIVYDLYRSEAGCDGGSVRIAAGLTGTTYRDTEVANFYDYAYRIVARPAGNEACSSPPSSCATAQPFPCVIPGQPSSLAGSSPQDHQVALSWSNGSPAGVKYNVYRALGTCAGGSFSPLVQGTAQTSFLDSGLPGSVTWAYRVTSTDATGECESTPRCVEVVPQGPCNVAPEFKGLSEVSNPGSRQCTLELAWQPASSWCGPAVYDVYRGSTPDFAPGPENLVARGLGGNTFADSGSLSDGLPQYYLVRARDLGNGLQDGNLVRRGAAPTGPYLVSNLVETFQGPGGFDLAGWSHQRTVPPPADPSTAPGWTWVQGAWFADEHSGAPNGKVLISPAFGVGPKTALRFWHRFALQSEPWYCRDGGTLEISTDNGATWKPIPDSAIRKGKFTNQIVDGTRNPISDKRAWCGAPLGSMSEVEVDLSGFAGAASARLRWYEGDDTDTAAAEPNGWYVDNVTISGTQQGEACTRDPEPLDFHPLPVCRLLDTREQVGPAAGGPALQAHQSRELSASDRCGVPPGARALAVNVTVTGAHSFGYLQIYPAHLRHAPATSFLNFQPGKARANSGIVMLSSDGTGRFEALNGSPGSVDVIVDVSGYFQ